MTRPVSFLMLLAALTASSAMGAKHAVRHRAVVKHVTTQVAPKAVPSTPVPSPPLPSSPPAIAPAPVPQSIGAGAPTLGRLRIFEDWAVGCDNRLRCSAVSLLPDGAGENYSILVWIEREGGASGESMIELSAANDLRGQTELLIDGEAAGQFLAAKNMVQAKGAIAHKLIRRLGSSYALEIRQGQKALAAPSLSGLAQALRYLDEQQGRVGSVDALAAIGDLPALTAKPAPEQPRFSVAPGGARTRDPVLLDEAERQAARQMALCDGHPRPSLGVEAFALDEDHLLLLAPCDTGEDNISSVILTATGPAGARQFALARFDLVPGLGSEANAVPLIVNAQWNPAQATLTSFARGRPLGDCGTSERYRWDGAMFRLIEARAMPVCRGAWEWPVLWSASPVDPAVNDASASSP